MPTEPHDRINWFDGGGGNYARFRPTYPPALAAHLATLAPGRHRALDVGCGSGQLTVQLADHFTEVVGTDPSRAQIANATPHRRVTYLCAPAEDLPLPDRCADLVTAAQAAHWFDRPAFYAEARRLGTPGAPLALISYGVLRLDDAAVQARFARFYDDEVGAFWPPERRLVDGGYADIDFPFEELPAPDMSLEQHWTLGEFLGYVSTWSAVRRACEAGQEAMLPPLRRRSHRPLGHGPAPRFLAHHHADRTALSPLPLGLRHTAMRIGSRAGMASGQAPCRGGSRGNDGPFVRAACAGPAGRTGG